MELLLERKFKGDAYTIGRLSINGKFVCDTLEDVDRDVNHNGVFDNGEVKIKAQTAIPYGTYKITLDVVSPKYSTRSQYKGIGAKLPRLLNVPSFEGILIHIGNYPKDTEGCILVGENKVKGQLVNSTATFNKLYTLLLTAKNKGEDIHIKIIP